jgi:hypothetical protein
VSIISSAREGPRITPFDWHWRQRRHRGHVKLSTPNEIPLIHIWPQATKQRLCNRHLPFMEVDVAMEFLVTVFENLNGLDGKFRKDFFRSVLRFPFRVRSPTSRFVR